MGILKSLLGNKPAPAPPAPAGSQGSRISYQKVLESINDKTPLTLSVRRCDVCGASFAYPNRFVNLTTTNISGVALDLGGYCPHCRAYVCPAHGTFAQNPVDDKALNSGSWRPACAACGTFLSYPDMEIVRVDESMVVHKGRRNKLSLRALLESRGVPFQTKTCGECGQSLVHPTREYIMARMDKKIGPADFEIDIGGHCQCCGYYVCGRHGAVTEDEDATGAWLTLTCTTCEGIPLAAEVHKVEPMPGVEWHGCFHKTTKKAIEDAMKAFSAPAKATYSFAALYRQNNIGLKDHRCDACGQTFLRPESMIQPQMDLKTAQDNNIGEDSFVADIGGYCHGCKKYLCPAHIGVFSADQNGRRMWFLYCQSCVKFLTPDERTQLPQG
ncbi:MAG TPA: hypothetical protein VLN41_02745 [Candidatus Bathyarchaeia archaeon]|nr:hypothetical protein [Candidatus Bathyarchaeia archaeon]